MVVYPYNFIGPLRPGDTRAPAPKVFQGPVRPGTDEEYFRRTGGTRFSGGGGGGGSQSTPQQLGPTRADLEAEQQRKAEAQAKAEQQRQTEVARQQQTQAQQQREITVSAAALRDRPISFQETIIDKQPKVPTRNIYTEPTIEKRQIDTFKDPKTGRKIPITGTFLIEPPGKGGGQVKETRIYPTPIPSGEQYIIKGYEPVTIEKELEVIPLTRAEKIAQSTGVIRGYKSVTSGITGTYEKLNVGLRESITEPTLGKINIKEARRNVGQSTEFLISKGVPSYIARTGEFVSGAGLGIVEDVKYKPLKYGLIYGATAGAGFAIGAATTGTTAGVGWLLGAKAGLYAGTTVKLGAVGAGLYLGGQYVSSTVTRIKEEPTIFGKGEIFGVAAGETLVGYSGFKAGTKLWSQTRGWWNTRGREFIEIPQGEYPTALPSKQLGMFKGNVYEQLSNGKRLNVGEELFMRRGNWINLESRGTSGRFQTWTDIPKLGKPGAFHTTSEVFWKGGQITPMPGTSELPGLYGSTQISTPFSRIQGSGSSTKFSLSSWFKNLFTVEGKPGVAYLQPEGFRYSSTIKQPTFIDGQKFSYTWKQPAKLGYADVPGIKTEIEAIFRPDAGGYTISSKGYYTTIKSVRVPIDSFVYDPLVVGAGESLTLSGGQGSYPGYTPSSYVPISVSTISPLYTSYGGGSLVSITPSYSSVSSSLGGSSTPSKIKSISPSYSPSYSPIIKPSSSKASKTSSAVNLYSSILPSSILKSSGPPSSSPPRTPSYNLYSSPRRIPPRTPSRLRLPKQGKLFKPSGRFQVFGRRFGKFKPIGVGRTEREAFSLGKRFASKTLGATFKIPGLKARKLPGYTTKLTKEGPLYIEPAKRRLKRGTKEIPEIQFFKRLKGGRK